MLHRERRVGNPPKRRNRTARESAKQTSPKNMDHTLAWMLRWRRLAKDYE